MEKTRAMIKEAQSTSNISEITRLAEENNKLLSELTILKK